MQGQDVKTIIFCPYAGSDIPRIEIAKVLRLGLHG